MQDVPQLYILLVGEDARVITSWYLSLIHRRLEVTIPFDNEVHYVPMLKERNILIFKYPIEDVTSEFQYENGVVRVKGKI